MVSATRGQGQIGFLFPCDVPEELARFLDTVGTVGGLRIPSRAEFESLFSKLPEPPQEPKPADFIKEAERRFPSKPLDIYGDIDRIRSKYVNQLLNKALDAQAGKLDDYQKTLQAREALIAKYPKPDAENYMKWLMDRFPVIKEFTQTRLTVRIPEENRQRHSYIIGETGCGKSELIKQMAFRDLTAPERRAVIVIDPHGSLTKDIARIVAKHDESRLVYFEPSIDYRYYPIINPMYGGYRTRELAPEERKECIALHSATLIGAIDAMLQSQFTENMQTLLEHCLCTILQTEDPSIFDLVDLTNPDKTTTNRKEYLLDIGKHSIFERHRDFFKTGYFSDYFSPTKSSVYARIQNLSSFEIASRCLTGESTIDLEREIDNGSILLFNLSQAKLPEGRSASIGSLILARLLFIAFSREHETKKPAIPIHVYIDECQNFISPRIEKGLTESRKYDMHLTMAQQVVGQKMDTQLKQIVLANTSVKIAGTADHQSIRTLANNRNIPEERLQNLKKWQFFLSAGQAEKVPFWGFDDFIDTTKQTPDHEWQKCLERQTARFYRSIAPTETARQIAETSAPSDPMPQPKPSGKSQIKRWKLE